MASLGGWVDSAALCAAFRIASAVAGPPTSADSTPRALIGVGPMLVSATFASAIVPFSARIVAATATIDHAWATRLNFS